MALLNRRISRRDKFMKVFVSTSEGQGLRTNDFNNCNEDEIVIFPSECDSEVDEKCGCRRSMRGLKFGATTTFKVIELEMTKEEYFEKFADYWTNVDEFYKQDFQQNTGSYKAEADYLLELASEIPVGLILEKRGNDIQSRARRIL